MPVTLTITTTRVNKRAKELKSVPRVINFAQRETQIVIFTGRLCIFSTERALRFWEVKIII